MATQLRFLRGMTYPFTGGTNGTIEFIKFFYEFWGYCVNGGSGLQTPGGMATTMSTSYSVSNVTGAGVSPIVVTTTSTHALATGQQVILSGVTGNLAANGQYQITVTSSTQFSLNGTTGNGSYTGGGTVNTTPFAFPVNALEGTNVLAIGNDGYTSAQISTNAGGNAIFTATDTNPFTSTTSSLTINQATNYQTTIAAGSNGQSLPQSTINVASTTTATATIAVASNGVSLPTATINVASTTGFPSGGYLNVVTTEGTQLVAYTGTTGTTFTGCTGGRGSMTTGGGITIGFPPSGTVNVTTGAGIQLVTYTGITGTTFTGCTGGTGTMSTGGAVFAPIQLTTTAANTYPDKGSVVVNGVLGNTTANGTWTINTPTYTLSNALYFGTNVAFQSNGASLPQATINSQTLAPFTAIAAGSNGATLPQATINVTATATASTTVAAASNNVALPTATINVVSTTGFPTAGTLNIATTATTSIALSSHNQTLPQSTIFVASTSGFPTSGTIQVGISNVSTTIAAGSNGQALPQATINVASTTGFPSSGFIFVTTGSGAQLVAYTGTTATTFTGCTGGGGTMSTGGNVFMAEAVTYTGVTGVSFTGCAGGTGTMVTGGSVGGGPFNQTVTYTGLTATTFTGASGGVGTMFTGNTVNNTGFFNTLPAAGTIYVTTSTGSQLVTYTGVTATTLTGCTGGSGSMTTGNSVFTAFSPASAYTSTTGSQSLPTGTLNVSSTTVASTTIAAASNGLSLPQNTISVASISGFPAQGTIYVTTSGGVQVVTYTGLSTGSFTGFTGCSGGSGTMSTGGAVTAGFPSSGYIYVTSSLGYQVITYTGITGTTFTGCTGGSGTVPAGSSVFLGYAPTGSFNVTTATGGAQAITYTGTTATTFTGCSGGSGTMTTGAPLTSPITIITTNGTTLMNTHGVVTAGIIGMPTANSTFTVTPISNRVFSLIGSLGMGAYGGDGSVIDHQNFVLKNSRPNGLWTSGGTQTSATTNMINKLLVIWKPGSMSTEDSCYVINNVVGNNGLQISLNTGGTPDAYTLHPSFTQRSNINYRVVDMGAAFNAAGVADGNYFVLQFNPSAVGINPGQANSQVQIRKESGAINSVISPGGNWNGVTFPVTGNYQIDPTTSNGSQSGGMYNGTPNGNVAITMAADPCFLMAHIKDVNSGDGSSYYHIEVPLRLYPQAADTNPVVCLNRGGVFNGSVFGLSNSSGQNFGRGFYMKGTDGVIRTHYSLAKSLAGDGTPTFGSTLTDFRLAFNTARGFVLASDVILTLPSVNGQFSLGRARLRTIKFTSTPLPLYHRFGTPGGNQYLNIQNGIAIIWDNTILPTNLLFII